MGLVVWIALCLFVSVIWRNRPLELVLASLVVWTFVPGVASHLITGNGGGSLGLHAATWLVLTAFLVQSVTRPTALMTVVARLSIFFVAIGLVISAAVLETKAGPSGHGVVLLTNEMVAPVLSYWLISAALLERPDRIRILRNGIITLAAVEAMWAIVQYFARSPILWTGQYAHQYWYKAGFDRWMGTTDHPLVLAVFVASAVPLLTGLRTAWLQQSLFVVMIGGVVITQSRTGVAAVGVGAIYVVWASRTSAARKIAGTVVLGAAALGIAFSSLSAGVSDRIANDSGSALARGNAFDYFLGHWTDFLWTGGGINNSYAVASNAGLKTSFESAFIMYSIDIGMVFAAIYFVAQLVLLATLSRSAVPGAVLATLIVLVLCQTFSSLEVNCLMGPLLWSLLALATNRDVGVTSQREEHQPSVPRREPQRRRSADGKLTPERRPNQRRPVAASS